MTLHIIVACHNRRQLTERAVKRAAAAARSVGQSVDFVVYDDGSTDGTASALQSLDLPVTILAGDGSAYWARGMASAEAVALRRALDGDWIVWLNDDVLLDHDAFQRALAETAVDPTAVYVATLRDPDTGLVSYGGYRRRSRVHPLRLELVMPTSTPIAIDSFNGNLVLVPVQVAIDLGGIEGSFAHAGADTDYGLRCVAAKHRLLLLPGTFGECARNPVFRGTLLEEWKRYVSVKGGAHPGSTARILQAHSSALLWPLIWLSTYAAWWIRRPMSVVAGMVRGRQS